MTLKEKLSSDLKDAMRAGDTNRRDTLRLLDSAIKNLEIEKKKRETGLSDEEVLEVISRAVKQRNESIRQFVEGGRPDLAEKEKIELAIIQPYLPVQLDEDAVTKIIQEIIASTGASSPADLGKIMGQAMAKLKGQADGNMVRQIAKQLLEK